MDDLLDLNWGPSTSSASKSTAPTAASNIGSASSRAASRAASPAYSAFDSLASTGSGYSPNYTGHYGSATASSSIPAYSSQLRPNSAGPPVARSPSPSLNVNNASNSNKTTSSQDAFDSLFDTASTTSTGSASRESSLTLQERMQLQSRGLGFDNTAAHSATNLRAPKSKVTADPWDFDMLSSTTKPATVLPSSNATQKSTKPSSPFDVFDDLEEVGARTQNLRIDQAPDTVRPFSAEAPHLSTDDDDILGLLGQPAPKPATVTVVAPKPTRAAANGGNKNGSSSSHTPSRPPSRATAARTPSPPPHILGQIVMMGFSVQQARLALAATLGSGQEGEWDVNAALEVLASDGAAHAARSRLSSEAEDARKFRDDGSDDEYERQQRPIAADRGKTRNQSDKPSEYSRRRDNGRDPHRSAREATRSPPSDSPANELLQQASVFGSSMLKSANAYWKTSRAQLQKAIEENRLNIPIPSGSNSGRASPASGKPRWMTDNQDQDDKRGAYSPERVSSFRDDDGGQTGGIASRDVLPVHPSERSNGSTSSSAMSGQSQQQNNSSRSRESPQKLDTNGAQPLTAVKSATLLGIPQEEKRAYVSPNRRRPVASEPPTPTSAFAPGASPVKPRPVRPARPPISATASQLAASTKHRAAGNEHFKLGRYGEAVEAYGKALESLPDGHVARIAPLNNRANARLKNGEERKASEDATAVLVILAGSSDLSSLKREDWEAIIHEIGASQGQSPFTEEGNGPVDARDALGKALSRRARGFEGCEKWRLALLDWQLLHELGDSAVVKSAGGMKVISEGLSRCRKVVEGPSTRAAPSSAPRPKTTAPTRSSKPISAPKATSLASVQHSAALDKLRQTNVQAEADEAERIRVKDAVDTRITEWRGGKETNLRALIASLDNVLWPELGWKSVGMHELISDSQLKVRYVRAISKVHPDKLGSSITVEQKLLANAVFSTLSDAWNAQAK